MRTVLARLNERVEFIWVVGQGVGLQDDELAAPDDDGGLAVDGGISQFAEFAFGLADGAGFIPA